MDPEVQLGEIITLLEGNYNVFPNVIAAIPKVKLSVFVSSTFTDTIKERNILHERILPRLQEEFQQENLQIIFSDLRFGIKDSNTKDHMTWIFCGREIKRCYEESGGMFFMSLQSEKYGYLSLPKFLPKKQFEQRLKALIPAPVKGAKKKSKEKDKDKDHANEEHHEVPIDTEANAHLVDLAKRWYLEDVNHVPPHYELKTLPTLGCDEFWKEALPNLREQVLADLAFETRAENSNMILSDTINLDNIVIGRSVTEWETFLALSLDPRRFFWIHRQLEKRGFRPPQEDGIDATATQLYPHLSDAAYNKSIEMKLDNLKAQMKSFLPSANIAEEAMQLTPLSYETNDATCQEYLKRWEELVYHTLSEEAKKIVRTRLDWEEKIFPFASLPSMVEEMIHHSRQGYQKLKGFIGREELLQRSIEMLQIKEKEKKKSRKKTKEEKEKEKEKERKKEASMLPGQKKAKEEAERKAQAEKERLEGLRKTLPIDLCVIGKSGSGKTAFMAKLSSDLYKKLHKQEIPVIVRFCGTSKDSLNAKTLMQSIIIQIYMIYGEANEIQSFLNQIDTLPFASIQNRFHSVLSQYPVCLLIDSLDQLSDEYQTRGRMGFLMEFSKNSDSRIIVSCLPDEFDEVSNQWIYYYQCDTQLKEYEVPRVTISLMEDDHNEATGAGTKGYTPPPSRLEKGNHNVKKKKSLEDLNKEVSSLIHTIMHSRYQRTITKDQMAVVLSSVRAEPTILYINLAIEIIRNWHSFDTDVKLVPTVKGLIHQIFEELEKEYGHEFVGSVFSLITFTRDGIHDLEIQDLLSLQDDVMKEIFQYSSLNYPRFPLHVWLRVKSSIQNLIVEKENHCLQWYHRQLWETAEDRYASRKEKTCYWLGYYFTNRVSASLRKERMVKEQSIALNHLPVWFQSSKINPRRSSEGIAALVKAGLFVEAIEELCSFESLCASARTGQGYLCAQSIESLLQMDAEILKTKVKQYDELKGKLEDFARWLRKMMTFIIENPAESLLSTATQEPLCSHVRKEAVQYINNWNRMKGILPSAHSSLHNAQITDDFINPMIPSRQTETWIQSISYHDRAESDEVLLSLSGHKALVLTTCFSPDCKLIASGSRDTYIKIWDSTTGRLQHTLTGHKNDVLEVSWNCDQSKFASCSKDDTIKIWNIPTGRVVFSLAYETKDTRENEWTSRKPHILTIVWHPSDPTRLASSSEDGTVKIWNAELGKLLLTLQAHSKGAPGLFWNPAGTWLISGSEDSYFKVWEEEGATVGTANRLQYRNSYTSGSIGSIHSFAWRDYAESPIQKKQNAKKDAEGKEEVTIEAVKPLTLLAVGTIFDVYLYDVATWGLVYRLSYSFWVNSGSGMASLFWYDDNFLVATEYGKCPRVWDLFTHDAPTSVTTNHFALCTKLSTDSTRRIVAASTTAELWSGETMMKVTSQASSRNSARVGCVSVKPDASCIAMSAAGGIIELKKASDGKLLSTIHQTTKKTYAVACVSWHPTENKVMFCCFMNHLTVYDIDAGSTIRIIDKDHHPPLTKEQLEAETEVDVKMRKMRRKNLNEGKIVYTLVEWNRDGSRFFAASRDGWLTIWDYSTQTRLHKVRLREEVDEKKRIEAQYACWNHDSTLIATITVYDVIQTELKFWDVNTGIGTKPTFTYEKPSKPYEYRYDYDYSSLNDGKEPRLNHIAWSPNGDFFSFVESYVAIVDMKNHMMVHDLSKKEKTKVLGNQSSAKKICWNKDNRHFITMHHASEKYPKESLFVWDAVEKTCLYHLNAQEDTIEDMYWSMPDVAIVSVHSDRSLKVWKISILQIDNEKEEEKKGKPLITDGAKK